MTWYKGNPKTFSLFWSGAALYVNVSYLRFTIWWRPILRFGAFRHA